MGSGSWKVDGNYDKFSVQRTIKMKPQRAGHGRLNVKGSLGENKFLYHCFI